MPLRLTLVLALLAAVIESSGCIAAPEPLVFIEPVYARQSVAAAEPGTGKDADPSTFAAAPVK